MSGVDTRRFSPCQDGHSSTPVVLMASRLLWDKGVGEFVQAARHLRARGVEAQFWIAGAPDEGNPACLPDNVLIAWRREGVVEFLGHRSDMPELLRQASIAVLPSYHEGLPRFLLEAAATGLPLVATDIEGCRLVVRDGLNGLLVPPKDSHKLAEAIRTLLKDPPLRWRMGKASRAIAESKFDEKKIIAQSLAVYREVAGSSTLGEDRGPCAGGTEWG